MSINDMFINITLNGGMLIVAVIALFTWKKQIIETRKYQLIRQIYNILKNIKLKIKETYFIEYISNEDICNYELLNYLKKISIDFNELYSEMNLVSFGKIKDKYSLRYLKVMIAYYTVQSFDIDKNKQFLTFMNKEGEVEELKNSYLRDFWDFYKKSNKFKDELNNGIEFCEKQIECYYHMPFDNLINKITNNKVNNERKIKKFLHQKK